MYNIPRNVLHDHIIFIFSPLRIISNNTFNISYIFFTYKHFKLSAFLKYRLRLQLFYRIFKQIEIKILYFKHI